MPSSGAARRSLRVSAKRSTAKLATRPGQKSVAMRGEGRARSWPERHPAGHDVGLGFTVVGRSPRDCTSGVRG
jgi:hypothetical protein